MTPYEEQKAAWLRWKAQQLTAPPDFVKASLFVCWLSEASPGERTLYHIGNLATDRLTNPGLDARAREVETAAATGLVVITQLRYYDLNACHEHRVKALAEKGYGFAHCYFAQRTTVRSKTNE